MNSHVVEAILHYFEMEDTLSTPRNKNVPENHTERLAWTKQHFTELIKESVGTFNHL